MSWCPELTSLQLLLAVGETGSITEAARHQEISQPAASKRIRDLERSMAMQLIERTPGGSVLTSEGKVVADWAGRVLETIDQMFDAVAAMKPHPAPDLRVASSMTIAEHLLPLWLSTLRAQSPEVHVELRVTNSQDVQRLVIEGQVDLGLVETTALDARLRSAVITEDRLAVVVAPSHPWADRHRALRIEDLAVAQLIVREEGSGTRETLDRRIGPHVKSQPMLELGSNAAVRGAVKAGAGPAVLSVLAVQEDLAGGGLVEVAVDGVDLRRPLSAVWPKGKGMKSASRALLEAAARARST
ncbi:MAG TPA: LysR family transcriptional regulator [Dehalococcoidia bacterium]|nr:LysR family transcriptional regulator [Dehalococcoidia bacterium]